MLFEAGESTEVHPALFELPSKILCKCLVLQTKETGFQGWTASCVVLGGKFTEVNLV